MKKIFIFVGAIISLIYGSASFGDVVVNGSILHLGGLPVGSQSDFAGDVLSTVDHISFSVNTAGLITFDTLSWEDDSSATGVDVNGDGEIAFFDPIIYLFNDDGSLDVADLIDSNDDSPSTLGDGSITVLDSWLTANLSAGNYILTIGGFFHDAADAIAGINPGTGGGFYPTTIDGLGGTLIHDHGDYRVTILGDVSLAAVPEPNSAMLLTLGFVLGLCRRHRKASGV